MSYQVLARKWRPKTFKQVVGQQHILTALANGLRENRLHHAYLFSGTRGVGKTSIARLFAKGLNCVNGITAEPCGECEHCRAIEQGNFIDLIEIDAASRTKVEDTRELLDNVQYKPVQGRYKVYLIDEVHMLSRHSFNALLKTLEEPPEYVKFLLATTDPQKLPITILSRCMQFHLKALESQQIAEHLSFILQQENIPYDLLALDKLANAAQGSIRDSLSLTDQAIALSNGNVNVATVNQMLGLLDDNQAIEVLYGLQQGDGEKVMLALNQVAERGVDWDELLRELAEQLHQIAMYQWLSSSTAPNSHIEFLASQFSPEDVQFFYEVMLSGRKELAFAPNRRMGVEMTLLRALAFAPKAINTNRMNNEVAQKPVQNAQQNLEQIPTVLESPKQPAVKQNPVETPVNHPEAAQNVKAITSPALKALTQLAVLDQLKSDSQKKKSSLVAQAQQQLQQHQGQQVQAEQPKISQTTPARKIQTKITALPVLNMPPESDPAHLLVQEEYTPPITTESSDLESTYIDDNQGQSPLVPVSQDLVAEGEEQSHEEAPPRSYAETYRWQWSNPELAKIAEAPSPSSIKHALEQGMTAELREKIIAYCRTQDKWIDVVESLQISGMTKELALNCCLNGEVGEQIELWISPENHHLNNPSKVQSLESALETFLNHPVSLLIQENELPHLTPHQYYEQRYQQLCEQAKATLAGDKALQKLIQKFAAELVIESVRPI